MDANISVSGTVWGVFGHRFALETETGPVLADLGPQGAARCFLAAGDRITVRGTRKPSEIKVETIVLADGSSRTIDWLPKPKHGRGVEADPEIALEGVRRDGFSVLGAPRRKPKHWEVDAAREGRRVELHVELDGRVRTPKDRGPA